LFFYLCVATWDVIFDSRDSRGVFTSNLRWARVPEPSQGVTGRN
jgi:hypothetical protein